jgi:putative spermidine/putrescine transport system substrate-binding protein
MKIENKKKIVNLNTKGKVTLRVMGTSVTLLENIRQEAEKDLGIKLEFNVLDGVDAQRVGVMHNDTYDIYDQWFHNIDFVWPARSIQPIELKRIPLWKDVNGLSKTLENKARYGERGAPVNRLYVQHNGSLGPQPTSKISMLPMTHNSDSFTYRSDIISSGIPYQTESWSWLLDDVLLGKVALPKDPTMGVIDTALAVSAAGLASFKDIGNLTLKEIDLLINILIERKKEGHFKAFWSNIDEAAQLMETGKVYAASMWSPSHVALKKTGLPVCLATPKEGYRAWYGGLALSAKLNTSKLDAAYDYLNWWLSGVPGAILARQGYYCSIPARVRKYLSEAEWDYWYEGLEATSDLLGPDGNIVVFKGEKREGGSYTQRMQHIAAWNSVMDEHNYLVRRWNDFMKI